MPKYDSLSDDFYVNMQLNTEMDLPSNRETILFFFEQLSKKYPAMKNFYSRERNEYVLEEAKDAGNYRWATVEPRRIYSAYVNPPSIEDSLEQASYILDLIPHALSTSPLDCESLSFIFGFDYTYRGNHDELVQEALGMHPALERMQEIPGYQPMSNEPSIVFALDAQCKTRCRVSIETRTTATQVRTNEYPEEQLSVFTVVRHSGSLDKDETFVDVCKRLCTQGKEILDQYVVESILMPLQQHIAIK